MEGKASTARSNLEQMLVDETVEPKAMPLSLLEQITYDFSDEQEIGRGGFAVVYKGILGDRAVAVKRLSRADMHETEFHREVQCLMRVKHKNIVRFLGYCADTQGSMERYNGELVMADVRQRLLCFEYIPKGSLDKYITDANREWGTCYKIIKGICEGLQYLHENHIIHLDLKPANILLDDNMVPKITDFGLSRCFNENQSCDITRTVLGTMGYWAPEHREGGIIARSADLYSIGVIIIEILTGQKGYQATEDVLESWSDRLERSHRDMLCEQIQVCYEIALECRDFDPKKRPASAQVIIDRLHEMENIQKLRESAIGILEVDILGARDLGGMKNTYVVAKYGKKWVRTRTLFAMVAPIWNEKYNWDVFDVSTVITIAVFHDSNGDGRDQRIGKVRVRLSTLESDRVYTQYHPLLALNTSGLKKMGELHLAVRFTCKSWAKMMAMYGKPLLPKMHHTSPISMPQLDYLRYQAMQMVATRLARADPPLRREVVEYMLDVDWQVFSLRQSMANICRITSLFSGVVAVGKWFDGICKWKNPLTTILVHVVMLKMVCYPELILPIVFLCLIMVAAWNYHRRPLNLPHMDTVLLRAELAHPDEQDQVFDTFSNIDAVLWWYRDQPYTDELDEEFDTYPTTSKPDDIVRLRYDRLRGIAGTAQTVVGDLATNAERLHSLLLLLDPRAATQGKRLHDPRLTAVFITFSLAVAIILYLTPFRVVAMMMVLYFLRPPWFRGRTNLFLNLYSRLPSKDDVML